MRRRLLAGSFGPERVPVRPDPGLPSWYQPLHVRDAGAARARLSSQVAAGADVVVAPTWLTHRRALLPVGETRRARAWTAAAVRVAREAVEMGLEARLQAAAAQDAEGAASAPARPQPLVAATLPAIDAAEGVGDGRLLPRDAASERDHHDQAGLLADAEPDLLLVEGQATPQALRHALDAVNSTGLPTWLALPGGSDTGPGVVAAIDLARDAAVSVVLLSMPAGQAGATSLAGPLADSGLAWGSWLAHPSEGAQELVRRWLEEGASAIALLDGATPAALALLREAIDAHERAEVETTQRAAERWWQLVRRAAAMAPGGRALWIIGEHGEAVGPGSSEPTRQALPGGFEWLIIHPDDAGHLPDERVRLLVDETMEPGAIDRVARLLEQGGCAAVRGASSGRRDLDLRVIVLDESEDPALAILRKEG